MKLITTVLLFTFTVQAWSQRLTAIPMNSPVTTAEAKFLLISEKGTIPSIEYVLYNASGKPLTTPATWKLGRIEQSKNGIVAAIPIKLLPGEYKVHLRGASKGKGNDSSAIFVNFSVASSSEVPDPGEEGTKTLAGIDSDNDGVRDDLQIWIAKNYPKDKYPSTFQALRQISKYDKKAMVNFQNKELALSDKDKLYEASACLSWIRGISWSNEIERKHRVELLNTMARIKAYMTIEGYLSGATIGRRPMKTPLENHNIFCEFEATKEK